ncbi:hypothetical protein TWF730_007352 [Orbilia blumenaviensis]|uniref:Uncharacterized protein n=1 Tax=Orbilia blumenaviensis TaxID=1796055 RepID=A0AAV9V888_9PEZI
MDSHMDVSNFAQPSLPPESAKITLTTPLAEHSRVTSGPAPRTSAELHIPDKTARLRYIRSKAAIVLSEALGKPIDVASLTFTEYHDKEYHWFLSITTVFNPKTGASITTEYELPSWTTRQMWRWKSHESRQMIEWLDHGLLKAERVGSESRIGRKQLEGTVGLKELEEIQLGPLKEKVFLEEVCITVYTEKEKQESKRRWTPPSVTIKGPASDFLVWMAGSADPDIGRSMRREYLGVDDGEGWNPGGVYISYGGFGGDPIVKDIPPDNGDGSQKLIEDSLVRIAAEALDIESIGLGSLQPNYFLN